MFNSVAAGSDEEELRRLFYVALTRAKKHLWLTYANSRYRFGNLVQNEPSRFLEEMPEAFIDRTFAGGGARNQSSTSNMGSAFQRMHRGFGGDADQAERRYGPPPAKKAGIRPEAGSREEKPSYLGSAPTKLVEHIPSKDFAASDTSSLQVGHKVEHQKFGFGEVTRMEGSAHNPIATVVFDKNGEKKIMLNYAKLRIVE